LPAHTEPAVPARDDDILAMFSATDSQAGQLAGEVPPVRDELLGMFEVPREALPFGEVPAASTPTLPADGSGEPDILDMFGIPPVKAEDKDAK
jgi:hypothetical protein